MSEKAIMKQFLCMNAPTVMLMLVFCPVTYQFVKDKVTDEMGNPLAGAVITEKTGEQQHYFRTEFIKMVGNTGAFAKRSRLKQER